MNMKYKLINYTFFVLLTTAIASPSLAADKDVTPGYNHNIPEEIMTPDKVETRIGTLEFFDGMPSA